MQAELKALLSRPDENSGSDLMKLIVPEALLCNLT